MRTVEKAMRLVDGFGPERLVVSLGLDTMAGDQAGHFGLKSRDMRDVGARIGELGLPTLVVQEGGYHLGHMGSGAAAFFQGLVEAMPGPYNND
jgi:acetoin utilization deacetylase AcuC-like enzyme